MGNNGAPSRVRPFSASGSFEQLVLQSSPTQYFELEEAGCCTASNIGSSGASGTYTSSNLTYSLSGPLQGETSTAIGLPGNSSTTAKSMGVSLPNPATSGAFTVEDWVFPTFTIGNISQNAYYTIWGYDGTHRLLINNQSGTQGQLLTQFGSINFKSNGKLNANAWNQVVYVYNGTTESFYINGALDSSQAVSGVSLSSAYSLGQYDTSAYYKLDGRIGQHMVFRSALSATVIRSHFSAATSVGGRVAKVDWPTWGMKPYRNSYNPVETTLTTANVGGLHEIWSTTAPGGGVFTDEPVIATNVAGTTEGTADLLFVGDAHANLYAMDANTGKVVWTKKLQTQFIDPNATATKGCADQPGGLYGIGGSPTIDRSSNRVYVVDALGNLYAFDMSTGSQKVGPVPMWPFQNGVNITNDYGGLNEDPHAGVIYVPGNAHCGLQNYGGINSYTISTGTVTHFYTEGGPPNVLGGVWGPGGVVIDPRDETNSSMSDLYFATAYGPVGTGKYPYSVVRLTHSLSFKAANNPITNKCCPDLDFGDTPLVFTPSSSGCGRTLVAAESKNGALYLYDADNVSAGPLQKIQIGTLNSAGTNLGTAAYDPNRNLVYINNGSDSTDTTVSPRILHGLLAFTVTASCQLKTHVVWQQTVGPDNTPDGPPAPPTVANGVVYYVDGPGAGCTAVRHPNCTGTADFYAFGASNGNMLFHTTLPAPLLTPPVVINGRVYLTTWNGGGPGIVYCFGL